MMVTLSAKVQHLTGATKHTVGVLSANGPKPMLELKKAVTVEITANEEGVFLFRFDRDGTFCGDTWHQSVVDAKKQAKAEFNILETDWVAHS